MFGAKIQTFNMRGRTKINTSCGACVSIMIFILTLIFALVKLEHLVERKNPSVTTNLSALEAGTRFNTNSNEFMMAFAASF